MRQSIDVSTSDNAVSTVPIWPEFVVPVLHVLESGRTLHRKDIVEAAADLAGLDSAGRAEMLNSGGFRYEQRVGWAISHLAKAGWITRPERAHYAITEDGHRGLAKYPGGFDYALGKAVFAPFWPERRNSAATPELQPDVQDAVDILDPIEQIADGISRIEEEVGAELLDRLRESHPDFFEQAIVDLMLAMGYGGAEQRGARIGGSGDAGIDGIIDQDALGLDRIYVQAKR
jgi:restriction system protein